MKKFLRVLTILVFAFIFIPKVDASYGDLIYLISDVSVNDNKVSFSGYALLHDMDNISPSITITAYNAANGQVLGTGSGNGSSGDYSSDYRQDIPSSGNTPDQFTYRNVEFSNIKVDLGQNQLCTSGSEMNVYFTISVTSGGVTRTDDMLIFKEAVGANAAFVSGNISTARVVTLDARVRKGSWNTKIKEWYSWGEHRTYNVAGVGTRNGRRFLVGMHYGTTGSVSSGGWCTPNYTPNRNSPFYVPTGSGCLGYAKSNWLQFDGTRAILKIKCDGEPQEVICDVNEHKDLTCSDGTFNNTCTEEKYSDSIRGYEETCSSDSGVDGDYVNKSISTTITRSEKGELKFDLPGGTFLSGTGFPFSVEYINTTSYTHNTTDECPEFKQYSAEWVEPDDDDEEGYWDCDEEESISGQSVHSGDTCTKNSEESAKSVLSKVIADRYEGIENSSSGSIMFGDGGSSGEWTCENDVNGNLIDGSWTAGETITSECYYELDNAYIDRKTGEISYGTVGNIDDYLSRGQFYYIPLDFPTGNFGVYGEFYDLGVQGMDSTFNWSASYECFINAQNRWDCVGEDCPGVIDCEIPEYAAAHPDICGGGDDDGSGDDCKNPEYREEHPIECENSCSNPEYYYANRDLCDGVGPGYSDNSFGFIYRPIDLYDPFPLRNPGSNWYYWYKGPNASANKHRLENTYNLTENSARLNYSVHLDAAHLNRIKEYNDQVETYLDDSINNDGTSDFFKVEKSGVPLEPKTNGIQGGNCPLGEYNESCGSGR